LVLTAVSISFKLKSSLTHIQAEFCIEEWSTGIFIKSPGFEEADNLPRYSAHLQKLIEWRNLNPEVVDKILQKKYDRMRYVSIFTSSSLVFMAKQEDRWYCFSEGPAYQDDRCCQGSGYERARRAHWRH
jgi:hypothetical protein